VFAWNGAAVQPHRNGALAVCTSTSIRIAACGSLELATQNDPEDLVPNIVHRLLPGRGCDTEDMKVMTVMHWLAQRFVMLIGGCYAGANGTGD
jgi:hypothetical protein